MLEDILGSTRGMLLANIGYDSVKDLSKRLYAVLDESIAQYSLLAIYNEDDPLAFPGGLHYRAFMALMETFIEGLHDGTGKMALLGESMNLGYGEYLFTIQPLC